MYPQSPALSSRTQTCPAAQKQTPSCQLLPLTLTASRSPHRDLTRPTTAQGAAASRSQKINLILHTRQQHSVMSLSQQAQLDSCTAQKKKLGRHRSPCIEGARKAYPQTALAAIKSGQFHHPQQTILSAIPGPEQPIRNLDWQREWKRKTPSVRTLT